MLNNTTETLIIGHKNPDTDSICSAIAYAYFKNQLYSDRFAACRAGDMSLETQWVLNRFNLAEPDLITDVSPQISDIEIQRIPPIAGDFTVKEAWERMRDENITTLPILSSEGRLEGLIALKDLAVANMDHLANTTLAEAATPYYDMARTIDGRIICGDPLAQMTKGIVHIGAGNDEMIRENVGMGDLIIISNRPDAQRAAIEAGAGCLVVCMNARIEEDILNLAVSRKCVILSTPFDAYKTSYLINQSVPVRFYMTSEGLITFKTTDFVDEAVSIMEHTPFINYPVLDENGLYAGMISRRSLINHNRKKVILMDHNELSQCVNGCDKAEIREIIDHHRVGGLATINPIYFRNQPVGSTCTIVYQMYNERHVVIPPQIAGAMCCAILSDTLMLQSPTCTGIDRIAVKKLAEIADIDIEETGERMFEAAESIEGRSGSDIITQDFKIFSAAGIEFGVGQATYMSNSSIENAMELVRLSIEDVRAEKHLSMLFFLLTDIKKNSSYVLCAGTHAGAVLRQAFDSADGGLLGGVVSRKKQFVPEIIEAIRAIQLDM